MLEDGAASGQTTLQREFKANEEAMTAFNFIQVPLHGATNDMPVLPLAC